MAMQDMLRVAGQVSAIGGLAAGVFLILFRANTGKSWKFAKRQEFMHWIGIAVLCAGIACVGALAWLASELIGSSSA